MRLAPASLFLMVAASLLAQAPAGSAASSPQTDAGAVAPANATVPVQQPAGTSQGSIAPAGKSGSSTESPAQPPVATIRTSSRLVILDTLVVDRKDNVVTGLRKEDFHVTEEDTPQTVLNFSAPGTFAPPVDAAIHSTADLDRIAPRAPVNIILLDEFNTRFEDMAFARYSLKKFLQKQPGKLDQPTMLIAVSLQKFDVLQDYTEDKDAILSALDHHFAAFPWQAHQFGWLAERYNQAFLSLMRVAQATIGHPGHKNMIWIGRGFPNLNMANVAIDQQQRVENTVQETVNLLRDARVTLYTIDPAGVQINPAAYGTDAALWDPFGGSYEFNKLARATGGRTFYGRNDVDAEIGTSIRDGASFYTLTYRPTGVADNPNKFRRIKITFDNPDYRAVTREGYYPQRGPARLNPNGPNTRLYHELAAANTGNMVYDGVPVSLRADPTDPEKFTVHVEARGLNWTLATDTEPRRAEVILIATLFDKKDKPLGKPIAQDIKVAAPRDVAPTGRLERSIDFNVKLQHNPKAVRARFVVRVASTGRIGTADTALDPNRQAVVATPAPSPANVTPAPATAQP